MGRGEGKRGSERGKIMGKGAGREREGAPQQLAHPAASAHGRLVALRPAAAASVVVETASA